MLHRKELASLSHEDLAQVDIVVTNLDCADGVPGAERLTWNAATGR
jgi:hypothetical protein